MASIRKTRAGKYYVQIRKKGIKTAYATFSTLLEAELWAHQKEHTRYETLQAPPPAELRSYTFFDVAKLYCFGHLIDRPTFHSTLKRLRCMEPHFPDSILSITKRDINAYRLMRLKQVATVTCRDEIQLISRIFRWADREMIFDEIGGLPNPCEGVPVPPASKPRTKVVSPEELHALLTELRPIMAEIVELAYETAMRRGEIVKLTPEHLHLDDRLLEVINGKTGDRFVPLTTRAVELLQMARDRCPSNKSRLYPVDAHSITTAVRRSRRKAGLSEDVRLHQMRHTRISIVARKGFNNAQIMAVSGHRDIRSVQRYTHLNAADVIHLLD